MMTGPCSAFVKQYLSICRSIFKIRSFLFAEWIVCGDDGMLVSPKAFCEGVCQTICRSDFQALQLVSCGIKLLLWWRDAYVHKWSVWTFHFLLIMTPSRVAKGCKFTALSTMMGPMQATKHSSINYLVLSINWLKSQYAFINYLTFDVSSSASSGFLFSPFTLACVTWLWVHSCWVRG